MAGTRKTTHRSALLARSAAVLCLLTWAGEAPADTTAWSTFRGSNQRTGCLDNRAGPVKPGVLWVYKAPEHFVASIVPWHGVVYLSGLGVFNTPVFHCLATAPSATKRVLWSITSPGIKQPTVCAPVIKDGLVILGDGMHQTHGAFLYCLQAKNGRGVWRLPVPGELRHIEASPSLHKDRVYFAAGDGGIFCVALDRVTVDGKEMDLAGARALLDARWKRQLAELRQNSSTEFGYADPLTAEDLPAPRPKLFWQQGEGKWHIDAPLAVSDQWLLAASSYLDEEQVGKRALLCLHPQNGNPRWELPLKHNPWAGVTLSKGRAIVGCSSIRFDTSRIAEAAGEVVAADANTGQIAWRRDVPGGVLGSVAVKGDTAFFCATDGKVRAWSVADGKEEWLYDAGKPFFAAAAVAGDRVYAADLAGVLHALDASNGNKMWTVSLSRHPAIQMPGMVYGSPLVSEGRVYLATCNVEGRHAGNPCVVVCLSEEADIAANGLERQVTVDRKNRRIIVPCRIAPRKLPNLADIYPLEVVATFPSPLGQKAHETVVTFCAKPIDIHRAIESLGVKAGKPVKGANEGPPAGPEVQLLLELPDASGSPRLVPIEETVLEVRTGKPLPPLKWHFTGSAARQLDPDSDETVYGADYGGTLATLFPVTDETVIQSDLQMKERRHLRLETSKTLLPPPGTPLRLIIALAPETPDRAGSVSSLEAQLLPRSPFGGFVPSLRVPRLPSQRGLIAPRAPAWLPVAETRTRPTLLPPDERVDLPQRAMLGVPPLAPIAILPAPPEPALRPVAAPEPITERPEPVLSFPAAAPAGTLVNATREWDSAAPLAYSPASEPAVTGRLAAAALTIEIPDPYRKAASIRLDRLLPDIEPPTALDGRLPRSAAETGTQAVALAAIEMKTVSFIAAGSEWKYLDDGSDQGAKWYAVGFDDGKWRTGPAPLGYGDTQPTVVETGPATSKHVTTYFRRTFDVRGASRVYTLKLRLRRDDGAVVYLNGKELARSNMPEGQIGFRTMASGTAGGADETRFFDFEVPVSALVDGPNVAAAEVHQCSPTSSDISFDVELLGIHIVPR